MARRPDERHGIVGALLVAQLTMGVVLGLVGTGVAFILMGGVQPRIMAAFVMATMPVGAIGVLATAAQARLRPELSIAPLLVQSVVWLGVVLVLAAAHGGLALYGVGFFGATVIQAVVTLVLTARITKVRVSGARSTILSLLRSSWPIGLAGVFVTAYYKIDGVLLFHYRGPTASAYYGAAYRVIDVLQVLPMTVSGVLLPLLASAERGGESGAGMRKLFDQSVSLLLAAAIPVAAVGAIIAPAAVKLIYGPHFHSSVYLLRVLLPAFVPICLGYMLTSQLILHGILRPYIVITFAGAVVNVAANVIAIPRYGAPAAAWATLGTEVLVMLSIASVVARRLGLVLPLKRVLRCLGAVAVASAAVWPVRSLSVFISIPVGVIVYVPCLLISRAVSLAELRALLGRKAAATA
jgi:O-antigen/teichoic acid export membrane protein